MVAFGCKRAISASIATLHLVAATVPLPEELWPLTIGRLALSGQSHHQLRVQLLKLSFEWSYGEIGKLTYNFFQQTFE